MVSVEPAYLVGASLPRSGHHYLEARLHGVLGQDFTYCGAGRINQCCGQVICTARLGGQVFFRKSHDSRLELPVNLDQVYYVVQHRSPWGRLLSYIEQQKHRKGEEFPIEDRAFAARWLALEAKYTVGFYQKWIEKPPANAIVIEYSHLTSAPFEVVSTLLQRIGCNFDIDRLHNTIEECRLSRARNVETPTYFPRDLMVSPYLALDLLADYDLTVREECPGAGWTSPLETPQASTEVREAYRLLTAPKEKAAG